MVPHNKKKIKPIYLLFIYLFQENPACTKNNNRDKLLLTNLADQIENNRVRESNYRTQTRDQESKNIVSTHISDVGLGD